MPSSESSVDTPSAPARKRPRLLDDAVKASSPGSGVSLGFSGSFASDNFVLMQVPESLLDEIGRDADRGMVKLVGSDDQDVVVVTGCQTFKLTKAETSNSLLLVPPPSEKIDDGHGDGDGGNLGGMGTRRAQGTDQCADGSGTFETLALTSFQYELSKMKPSLEQIRGVLEHCFYQGADVEASIDQRHLEKCSLVELQKRVQFSQQELLEGLRELEAILIDGRYRIVDPDLMDRTADALLGIIVEQDMPLDKLDSKTCLAALPECEPLVLEHCLRTYCIERERGEGGNQGMHGHGHGLGPKEAVTEPKSRLRLDLEKVARLRAHQILRAHQLEGHDGPLSLADFVEQWAASMPGVDTPSESLLKGIALVDRKGTDDKTATVSYVPASSLPFAPAERLAALFRIKPKWLMEDIEAYISEGDKKSGFLLKHTRFSRDPDTGKQVLSAR